MDDALLTHDFAKIGCFLLKLQNCIVTEGFTNVTEIFCYRYSTISNSAL